jgi:hypothetical protein
MIAFWLGLGLLNAGTEPPAVVEPERITGGAVWWPEPKRRPKEEEAVVEAVQEAAEALAEQHDEWAAYDTSLARHLDAQLQRYAGIPLPQIDLQALAADVVAQWLAEAQHQAEQARIARMKRDEEAFLMVLAAL